jgi:hypothetical protein
MKVISKEPCKGCGSPWVDCSWDLIEGAGPCCRECSHVEKRARESTDPDRCGRTGQTVRDRARVMAETHSVCDCGGCQRARESATQGHQE